MPADSGVPRFYDLSGYTILVIDDHEDSLFLVLELLRHCHADVIGASDTDEARRILHERIPDLIITDLNLPRETGLQFAEWVREAAPNEMLRRAPIIAITATSPRIGTGRRLTTTPKRTSEFRAFNSLGSAVCAVHGEVT